MHPISALNELFPTRKWKLSESGKLNEAAHEYSFKTSIRTSSILVILFIQSIQIS